ncbi:MAG TPA: hypothetical protein VH834_09700 [Solirubrobacteraceae bacterium]
MTSREHARRLMLILLASEGTALRKAADDRAQPRRDRAGGGRTTIALQGSENTELSGEARERGVEEWRMWATPPTLGVAHRAP